MPVLYTVCFDIHTGDVIDLRDKLPELTDFKKSYGFTKMEFKGLDNMEYPAQTPILTDTYTPPEGSGISDAWILHECVNIYLTEPDGRVLQFFFYEDP